MHAIPDLSPSASREAYARLCRILPPPAIDTPEARAEQAADAMAAVAALHPGDPFEARLAVQIVAADIHAMDCLGLAAKYFNSLTDGLHCRAQAAVMMRQMLATLRTLQRLQAARAKTGAAAEPQAPPLATPAPPPPPTPQPEAIAEAEEYAARHPYRAIRIRAEGGLPTRLDFTPPRPEVVQAIATGTTPALLALDKAGRKAA